MTDIGGEDEHGDLSDWIALGREANGIRSFGRCRWRLEILEPLKLLHLGGEIEWRMRVALASATSS
jgi:hypothetical protein